MKKLIYTAFAALAMVPLLSSCDGSSGIALPPPPPPPPPPLTWDQGNWDEVNWQ